VQVTSSGTILRGWRIRPAAPNGGAVLLLHGVADSRTGMLLHASYLLNSGFEVLLPDARGHGASGDDLISYGVREATDVARWADLLAHDPAVSRTYGMGESMGAAILLQSLQTEHRFQSIVAESPFATFHEVAAYRVHQIAGIPELLAWPIVKSGFVYARLRYGLDLNRASPLAAIRHAAIPILLIHGTRDVNIPLRESEELHAANPVFTTLWIVEGASHVAAHNIDPQLYERKVLAWFNSPATHSKLGYY